MQNEDYVKEWGSLIPQGLTPSDIPYKPLINIRTVHGGSTVAKARKVGVSDRGGSDIKKEAQGGRINDRN